MSEGAPIFNIDNLDDHEDTEVDLSQTVETKRAADQIRKLMDKIIAYESGLSTELDESARMIKAQLQQQLGAFGVQQSSLADDEDD